MTDAVVSPLGQRKLAGDQEALFRDIYMGEVLTAYQEKVKLADKVRNRDIANGKSASFNAINKASGGYHTPGTEIVGKPIEHTDIVIPVDNELISDTFIASIHEAKNHYDVRAPYSREQGHYLALQEDRNVGRMIIKAARGAELFAGDGGGSQITNAGFANDGAAIAAGIYEAKEAMESKDVDVELNPVYAALKAAEWYLVAQAEKMQNRDFSPGADYAQGSFETVGGVTVLKSQALPWGRDDTPYHASTNTDGTVGNPAAPFTREPVLPAKYQLDMANTVGAVWTPDAAAIVRLLGMDMSMDYDPRRRGYLMVAAMAQGLGTLRNKCAVELKTA